MELWIAAYIRLMAALRDTQSANARLQLLLQAFTQDEKAGTILALLRAAYDPYRPYYIKALAQLQHCQYNPAANASAHDFHQLLDRLTTRELSGKAAVAQIRDLLAAYDPTAQAELVRIIGKDVQAGITAKTVNTAITTAFAHRPNLRALLIPSFEVMLAKKVDSFADIATRPYPVIAEHKYDGERCIIFVQNRHGAYASYSREGRAQPHYAGIFTAEVAAIATAADYDALVLDCEVIADSFRGVATSKGAGADKSRLQLVVFDMMTADEWHNRNAHMIQSERTSVVSDVIGVALATQPHLRLMRSHYQLCSDALAVQAFYESAIADGLEGLVIKDPAAQYAWKRSGAWLKWKPVNDVDGIVESIFDGAPGTQYEGTVGGLTVRGQTENGLSYRVSVGSGISDSFRAHIQSNRDAILGRHIRLLYDCLTEPDADGIYSLRFPRLPPGNPMRPDLE